MTAIAIIGISSAGGGLLTANASSCKVKIGGNELALKGCTVAPHGGGAHASATVQATTQSKVTVNGIPVVLVGDIATCNDPVVGGSTKASIG